MKKVILFFFISTCFFSACNESPKEQKDTRTSSSSFNLQGYWANIGFMSRAKQTGLAKVNFYCTEMLFDRDSVTIDNGFESYKLKYILQDSLCILCKAFQDKDLELRIETPEFIQFKDTALNKIHGSDFFNRMPDNGLKFNAILNENLLVGEYSVYNGEKKTDQKVEFKRNGELKGLPEFMSYQICYSGDCQSSPDTAANIVTLKNRNAEDDDYVWTKDYATNRLRIFQLAPAVPDMKGARKVTKLLFDLRP